MSGYFNYSMSGWEGGEYHRRSRPYKNCCYGNNPYGYSSYFNTYGNCPFYGREDPEFWGEYTLRVGDDGLNQRQRIARENRIMRPRWPNFGQSLYYHY